MVGERESAGRECIDAGTLKYVRAIAATAAASATTAKDPSKGLQHQPSTSATTTTPKTDALATVSITAGAADCTGYATQTQHS